MKAAASSSRGRRAKYAAMTAVLVLAATASLAIAVLLGERFATRVDVTATGEHRLSPRTRQLLEKLHGEYEIVLAGPLKDRRLVDPRVLQRVADVLEQLSRSGRVRRTLIDTGSAAGIQTYEDLLRRLAARDADRIAKQQETVRTSATAARQLADSLEELGRRFAEVGSAISGTDEAAGSNRGYFQQRAGESASSATALRTAAGKAEQGASSTAMQLVPDTEAAAGLLKQPLADLEAGLVGIVRDLERFGQGSPDRAGELAKGLVPVAGRMRDAAATSRDLLERMERVDLVRVAKALQGSSAAIVIGPPEVGLTAIGFEELFPPTAAAEARGGADLGQRAEELLSTAVAALAQPVKPIVVLVHGQSRGFFDRISFFELMKQRLGVRGIDVVMWDAAVDQEQPSLARLDPRGDRPVVYIVFNTASYAGGGTGQSGPERAQQLGAVVTSLVNAGRPVLMSVFPSTMPTYGEPDPTTAWMAWLGLEALSGKPILRERVLPEGRRVDAAQTLRAIEGEHPISMALRGLPTKMEWPIAIVQTGGEPRARVTPLYRVEDKQAWGESQWLSYMQVPIAQHASVPNPPSKDSRDDASGGWMVGAAVERTVSGVDRPQRLIVIGSNSWFTDQVMGEAASVDGRIVPANPGNLELMEASIYWLAGQDDAIAQSATARAVPLIRSLDPGMLSLLRWLAIAGLPGAVLGLGVLWRLLRG